MPVQRNRFPDYFGTARSIEPVGGNRLYQYDEDEDAGQDDGTYADQPAYPLQSSMSSFRPNSWASSGTQQRTSRTTAQGLQNLQQFAYGGSNAQPAAARPPASTYGQLNTPRRPPSTPWSNRAQPQELAYDQPGTRINWSRRPDGGYYAGMRSAQMPDAEENDDVHEVPASQLYAPMKRYTGKRQAAAYNAEAQSARRQTRRAGPTYDIQHRPQGSWTPRSAQPAQITHYDQPLPPTPRTASPSSLSRNPIQPVHRPAPRVNGIELVSPRTSLDVRFHSIFPYEHFNAMQSSCFPSVYGSNDNVVVASPTGSGKTAIFELAICRLLAQRDREKQDFKIVYQAPTKALCSERARDWQAKFSRSPLVSALGKLQVAEFTGDSSAFEVRRVRTASIIITTPEKWDSITRKWSDQANNALLRSIKLVLIDEVHILKDSRGATLETVVSRMKTLGNDVRFVALSATIPNSKDIAQWLGLTHIMPQVPARTFVFGEEFRPVQLQKIVLGFNVGGGGGGGGGGPNGGGSNEHTLDNILDDQLPDLIVKHAQGKPVLIFCFSRKSTESAATALAEFWASCPPHQRPWPAPSVSMRSNVPKLQSTIASGVAFHHGGVERQDREMVEDAFLKGHMSIICCTSTLAVGVNLPCHTVILKGTMGYQNGKFAEYDEFELMQMIGRAGRPQFDTSATAIILTRAENRDKYLNLESGRQTVESTLHLNLIEHLNSEIVLGTITSLTTAIHWLKGTFLAVRLHENPNHYYQLANAAANSRTTDQQLEEICKVGISRLAEVGLLKYVDAEELEAGAERSADSKFHGTEYGSAMSTYMIRFETMVQVVAFEKKMSIEQLLNAMCHAAEFDDMRVKSTERPILRELNTAEADNIPFRFKDNIAETWQKVSLLIQVELSRGTLPYQHGRFSFEARHAMEHMQRLLECYIICTIADRNGHNTRIALELLRSIGARAWEGDHHPAQLCQVPDIGPVNMRKLVDKKVTTVRQLAELGPVSIERFLSKNPPAAMKIAETMRSFPMLAMKGQVSRCSTGNRKAVAQVTVAFANEGGPPRWRNRVPALTFLAETAEGDLLHIWRGKLQANRLEHEMTFSVPIDEADEVLCYVACDEIVGTLVGAQLSVVDVLPSEMQVVSRFVKPAMPAKAASVQKTSYVQKKQTSDDGNPTKRQKTQHITPGSIGTSHAGGSTSQRDQTLPGLRDDSFAFQSQRSLSVKNPKHCSGGGTQTDPFTLDSGSDIDDFDSDIFDDLDVPVVDIASVDKTQSSSIDPSGGKTTLAVKTSPLAVNHPMAPPPNSKDVAETPLKPRSRAKPSLQLKRDRKGKSPETKQKKSPISSKLVESPVRQKFRAPPSFESLGWDTSEDEDKNEVGIEESEDVSSIGGLEVVPSPEINADIMPALSVAEETRQCDAVEVQGTPEFAVECTPVIEDNVQKMTDDDDCPEKRMGSRVQEEVQSPKEPPQEPPRQEEPSWVSTASNSSIIDFLRGHVKFV